MSIEASPLIDAAGEDEDSMGRLSDDELEDGLTGCGATPFCHPRKSLHRYIAVFFICMLGFGSYYCYDNPGALEKQIKSDMGINTAAYTGLYSWYSWPNVVLCFFGGFLIDRLFGIRLGAIIFSFFIMAGQVVFALGAYVNQLWLMDAGRFIFGIGGESLAVAGNTYVVSWFKGKELNAVFGLQLSFSRIGSTVNFNTMERIYDSVGGAYTGHEQLGIALFIATVTCVFSFFCAIIIGLMDKRAARILKKDEVKTGDKVKLTDVKDFPAEFWLLSIVCVGTYVAVFPFISLSIVYFENKFDISPGTASLYSSLVYFISAGASPVLGFLIDKFGRNVMWVLMSAILLIASHGLLAFTFLTPLVAMIMMGIAYSMLASSLWPMVSLVIKENQLGTAYGMMQSIQNLGLGVVSQVAGIIVDGHGYLILEVFFIDCLCLGIISIVLLFFIDASKQGILNMTPRQREELEKRKNSLKNDPPEAEFVPQ